MRIAGFILVALLFSACTHRVDLSRIQKGMTRSEVVAILGEPPSKFDMLGVEVLTYGDDQVTLSNDTVVQVGKDAEGKVSVELDLAPGAIDSLMKEMESR